VIRDDVTAWERRRRWPWRSSDLRGAWDLTAPWLASAIQVSSASLLLVPPISQLRSCGLRALDIVRVRACCITEFTCEKSTVPPIRQHSRTMWRGGRPSELACVSAWHVESRGCRVRAARGGGRQVGGELRPHCYRRSRGCGRRTRRRRRGARVFSCTPCAAAKRAFRRRGGGALSRPHHLKRAWAGAGATGKAAVRA
jgi:hypothetical protein